MLKLPLHCIGNFCDPNPCVNGACANGQSQYTCTCSTNWSGVNCDTCEQAYTLHQCEMIACYNCRHWFNYCSHELYNFTVVMQLKSDTLRCPHITQYMKHCLRYHHRIIIIIIITIIIVIKNYNRPKDSYRHLCMRTRFFFHFTDNYCASSPCQNGGTCTNGKSGFTCQCVGAWCGDRCQSRDQYYRLLSFSCSSVAELFEIEQVYIPYTKDACIHVHKYTLTCRYVISPLLVRG